MASIMDTLLDVLDEELSQYRELLALSNEKTRIVIENDVEALIQLTDREQVMVDALATTGKRRQIAMKDVADVMNKKADSFRLTDLIELLSSRPEEQKRLAGITDQLREVAGSMKLVNEQNRELIQSALDMVEFDLNLVRGMKAAPETAQYNSGGYTAGNRLGVPNGKFDAKQ